MQRISLLPLLVGRGPFGVVDDELFDGAGGGFELQADAVEQLIEGRAAVVDCRIVIKRPVQVVVEGSGQAGLVDYGRVDRAGCVCGQLLHRRIEEIPSTTDEADIAVARVVRIEVRRCGRFGWP